MLDCFMPLTGALSLSEALNRYIKILCMHFGLPRSAVRVDVPKVQPTA